MDSGNPRLIKVHYEDLGRWKAVERYQMMESLKDLRQWKAIFFIEILHGGKSNRDLTENGKQQMKPYIWRF